LPAYVILQDSALREIAIAKPKTAEELLQISGIGSKRLSMWGEDILRLVSEFIFSSV
jgi:ATP-dependent DNA helicase RecQ